ncbi:MAG: cytidylate kinase family protein [Chloroflexi bacterium]|nr:cytidylate kinase family protein [Chloroflexota bacterium]
MPIVTIARLLGSRGDEIGRALAEHLHYRYLDRHLLLDSIREFGDIEPNAPEIAETRPSFWDRLNEERRRHAIVVRYGVYGFAREDDCVIVGLGSNFLLRGLSHVLRVMIVAPNDVRRQRVIARQGGNLDVNTASEVIRRSDRERSGYIRYMHNADWMDPHAYDLIVNTSVGTVEQIVDFIAYALERAEISPTATSLQQIDDQALAARVEAVLISNAGIWIHGLRATAERGVVTIAGEVITDEDREYAEEIARDVAGVRAVANELRIQPPPLTGM